MRRVMLCVLSSLSAIALSACASLPQEARSKDGTPSTPALNLAASDAKVVRSATAMRKRPDPTTVHFIQGFDVPAAPGTTELLGRIWFKDVDAKTYVDYHPALHRDDTATRIVLFCLDTKERVSFPIYQDYYGPAPACSKDTEMVFAAQ